MILSVIIPCYNSDSRLDKTIESVVKQESINDIEIILVNDYSSNTTYIDKYRNKEHIRVIDNDTNLGLGMVRQKGMELSSGEWITFLDHDDEFTVGALDNVLDLIQEYEDTEICIKTDIVIANNKDEFKIGMYKLDNGEGTLHGRFFKRKGIEEYNIHFHKDLKTSEDTYFMALINGHQTMNPHKKIIQNVPITTYVWYLWQDSTSHKDKDTDFMQIHFDDYVYANLWSFYDLYKVYPTEILALMKFPDFVLYAYFYSQNITLETCPNKDKCLYEMFESFKNTTKCVSADEMYEALDNPKNYWSASAKIVNAYQIGIPKITFRDFIYKYY